MGLVFHSPVQCDSFELVQRGLEKPAACSGRAQEHTAPTLPSKDLPSA